MKHTLSAFLLVLCLASCKKDTGDEDTVETYATVKNNVGNAVTGIKVASYDGVRALLLKEVGTLQNGETSAQFKISGDLEWVYIYFTQNNSTYAFNTPFGVAEGIVNNLVITGGITASKIEEDDPRYPLAGVGFLPE